MKTHQKVIGKTRTGKPIYEENRLIEGDEMLPFIKRYEDFTFEDHTDAENLHIELSVKYFSKFEQIPGVDKSDYYRKGSRHQEAADLHNWMRMHKLTAKSYEEANR